MITGIRATCGVRDSKSFTSAGKVKHHVESMSGITSLRSSLSFEFVGKSRVMLFVADAVAMFRLPRTAEYMTSNTEAESSFVFGDIPLLQGEGLKQVCGRRALERLYICQCSSPEPGGFELLRELHR